MSHDASLSICGLPLEKASGSFKNHSTASNWSSQTPAIASERWKPSVNDSRLFIMFPWNCKFFECGAVLEMKYLNAYTGIFGKGMKHKILDPHSDPLLIGTFPHLFKKVASAGQLH